MRLLDLFHHFDFVAIAMGWQPVCMEQSIGHRSFLRWRRSSHRPHCYWRMVCKGTTVAWTHLEATFCHGHLRCAIFLWYEFLRRSHLLHTYLLSSGQGRQCNIKWSWNASTHLGGCNMLYWIWPHCNLHRSCPSPGMDRSRYPMRRWWLTFSAETGFQSRSTYWLFVGDGNWMWFDHANCSPMRSKFCPTERVSWHKLVCKLYTWYVFGIALYWLADLTFCFI